MCNEEIIKHMEEDMTFRGLAERTKESYIFRVKRYMEFHKGRDIEKLTEDDIRDFLKYLVEECKNKRRDVNTYNSAIRFMYGTTLNKVLNLKRIPYRYYVPLRLPSIRNTISPSLYAFSLPFGDG